MHFLCSAVDGAATYYAALVVVVLNSPICSLPGKYLIIKMKEVTCQVNCSSFLFTKEYLYVTGFVYCCCYRMIFSLICVIELFLRFAAEMSD